MLPSGRFQLIVDLTASRAAVSGIRSTYTEIDSAAIGTVMGIVFRPGGTHGLFDVPSSDFHNEYIPLQLAWGRIANDLLNRLGDDVTMDDKFHALEDVLLCAIKQAGDKRLTLHPSVEYALETFRRAPQIRRVTDVAREAKPAATQTKHT